MNPQENIESDELDSEAEAILPRESFAVVDTASANWVLRKLNEEDAYIERVKAFADRETERAKRSKAALLERFGAQLEAFTERELEGGKRKSLALPGGKMGFRTCPPRLKVSDEEAAIDWARRSWPDAIKTTQTIRKMELQRRFEETGELPDGTFLEHEREEFYVR